MEESSSINATYQNAVKLLHKSEAIMVLTGAGISSDSGIPTFRGKDGMWVPGTVNYTPQDFATFRFFKERPELVLEWYKERQKMIKNAKPNEGHFALAKLEKKMVDEGKKFLLVTQNIDNLHQRAGSKHVAEIHGNIFYFRCSSTYSKDKHHLNLQYLDLETVDEIEDLRCKVCNSYLRPNVLGFDETYDDRFFDVNKVASFSREMDLMIIVGTTLQTTLPYYLVQDALNLSVPIIEVNPEPVLEALATVSLSVSASVALPKIISIYQ